jgi:hypothetical protein
MSTTSPGPPAVHESGTGKEPSTVARTARPRKLRAPAPPAPRGSTRGTDAAPRGASPGSACREPRAAARPSWRPGPRRSRRSACRSRRRGAQGSSRAPPPPPDCGRSRGSPGGRRARALPAARPVDAEEAPTPRRAPKPQTPAAGAPRQGWPWPHSTAGSRPRGLSSGSPRHCPRTPPSPRPPGRPPTPRPADRGLRLAGHPADHDRPPGLDDSGLLGRDRPERVSQQLAVIQPIDVMTLTSGSTMFVASSRPPRPTSMTLTSQRFLANWRNAIAVMNSKKVGRSPESRPLVRSRRPRAAARDEGGDLLLGEDRAVDLDALPEAHEVRRRVEAGPLARRAQDRLEHRGHRALPVRAGDMDAGDRPLRMADPPERIRIRSMPNLTPAALRPKR